MIFTDFLLSWVFQKKNRRTKLIFYSVNFHYSPFFFLREFSFVINIFPALSAIFSGEAPPHPPAGNLLTPGWSIGFPRNFPAYSRRYPAIATPERSRSHFSPQPSCIYHCVLWVSDVLQPFTRITPRVFKRREITRTDIVECVNTFPASSVLIPERQCVREFGHPLSISYPAYRLPL